MKKPVKSLDIPSITPVRAILIEPGEPTEKEGVNTTFVARSLGETSVKIGDIEGFIEPEKIAEIDSMEVYDEWRGRGFGSQLFTHFIQHAMENNVKKITASVANERSAHMMSTIPGVKKFELSSDNIPLDQDYTIKNAIEALEFRRKMERPGDPDIDEMLGMTIRIDAHL